MRMPEETLRAIQSAGGEVMGYAGNIADESVVEAFAKAAHDKWGRADALVNNAGISMIAPAETISGEAYRRVLEVNLVAPFFGWRRRLGRRCWRPSEAAS